ncbi:MAG TPA: LPS assembly lipoprotein LptE [Xanthobacteraceae bacterium]|jgi:LPS-assembly lipoprotein|nr:LPS assembly lipoprotein LptE [Xanthobacteraceae bacterium]
MWWREPRIGWRRAGLLARLAIALAAASLTAGCFEPLYGSRPSPGADSVHDKLASIALAPMNPPKGTPTERVAVQLHNALQFDLTGGGASSASTATYRLEVSAAPSEITVVIDPVSGRPDAQIGRVTAHYVLTEIASGKAVVRDSTIAEVDYDVPGPQQRFARQRAQRDAEDRAVQLVAETIRNRLASYFVAGT